jgi:hypothetical protein
VNWTHHLEVTCADTGTVCELDTPAGVIVCELDSLAGGNVCELDTPDGGDVCEHILFVNWTQAMAKISAS